MSIYQQIQIEAGNKFYDRVYLLQGRINFGFYPERFKAAYRVLKRKRKVFG